MTFLKGSLLNGGQKWGHCRIAQRALSADRRVPLQAWLGGDKEEPPGHRCFWTWGSEGSHVTVTLTSSQRYSIPAAIAPFVIARPFLQPGDLHCKWCLLGP